MSGTTVDTLRGIPVELRRILGPMFAGVHSGTPASGANGTFHGVAPAGSMLLDTTNKSWYFNTGTKTSPDWEPVGAGHVSSSNTQPGVKVVYAVEVTTNADGDDTVTLKRKTRVTRVETINYATGTTGSTITVKNGSDAITDAIDVSGADKTTAASSTIDDANWEIAAGGTLTVSHASTGGDFGSTLVLVEGYLVA